jgi:hypothetical protein
MKLIPTKANREIISWIGGGAVVVVGAAWTVFTYLHDDKKPSAPMATVGSASQSIIAPGSTFNGPVNLFDEKKNREEIRAELENVMPMLKEIARNKDVPIASLRATLVKMGEENVPDDEIMPRLNKIADKLNTLTNTIIALKRAYPDLAPSIDQIQASVDGGDFGGGAQWLRRVFEILKINDEDFRNAMTISDSMQTDNQKQQIERWKILKDTQEQIFSIQQDVTQNKAQTQDEAYKKWDQYIRP